MLKRALNSLVTQSYRDWICELHNDSPNDCSPAELLAQVNDSRIVLINHRSNLGPTRSFNLAFESVAEEFVSLLEDDNWWDPDFLKTMLEVMDETPRASLGWANMRVWQEGADDQWISTGATTCKLTATTPMLIEGLNPMQMEGAIHSNGAMLVRSDGIADYKIPDDSWFDFVESIRERAFRYPIVYVPLVLANFSLTVATSRTQSIGNWNAWQGFLRGSFLKFAGLAQNEVSLVVTRSVTSGRVAQHFVTAAAVYPETITMLRGLGFRPLLRGVCYFLLRPHVLLATLVSVRKGRRIKHYLDSKTESHFRRQKASLPRASRGLA